MAFTPLLCKKCHEIKTKSLGTKDSTYFWEFMVECNIESGSRLGGWTPTPPFTPIGFAPRKQKNTEKMKTTFATQNQYFFSNNKALDFQVLGLLWREFNYLLLSSPSFFYKLRKRLRHNTGDLQVKHQPHYSSAHLPELINKQVISICCKHYVPESFPVPL